MSTIYLLNKPYRVLSQFSDNENRDTLAKYIHIPEIYPAGRLDFDSEGLLILTGDGAMQARIAEPRFKLRKHYWAQLEGDISEQALERLRKGVDLNDGPTAPALANRLTTPPSVWPRTPPIRFRQDQTTSWIELGITEGRNRQVRRMTAAVGFPTLRLIRHQIGPWKLENLQPGEFKKVSVHLPAKPSRKNSRPGKTSHHNKRS